MLTFYLSFLKKNRLNVLDVINICCCCLIQLFVLPRFLNSGSSLQLTGIFYSTEVFALEAIFLFIHEFFGKYLNFWGFLSVLMWMSGVGPLCANAHYRASLFFCKLSSIDFLNLSDLLFCSTF